MITSVTTTSVPTTQFAIICAWLYSRGLSDNCVPDCVALSISDVGVTFVLLLWCEQKGETLTGFIVFEFNV